MVAITSSLKKIANTAERIAHVNVRGSGKVKAVVKEVGARIEKERMKGKAKKAAKAEQRYQDFEREHLSESARNKRDLEKSKEELREVKEERRKLKQDSRKRAGKNPYSIFSSGRSRRDPLDMIAGRPAKSGKGRKLTADYSLGGSNVLNIGSSGKRKKKSRLF